MSKAEKSQKGFPGRATGRSKDQEGGSPRGAGPGIHENVTETRRVQAAPEDSESHGKALTCWGRGRHRVNAGSILVIRIRL